MLLHSWQVTVSWWYLQTFPAGVVVMQLADKSLGLIPAQSIAKQTLNKVCFAWRHVWHTMSAES